MLDSLPYLLVLVSMAGIYIIYSRMRRSRQLAYIRNYHFHKSIRDKLLKKHPHITEAQSHMVFRALRDYFWMCNKGKRNMVAMPSQVVDDAWHEFILFTRSYKLFCSRALGRFLHHTPTEAMSSQTLAQEGIKRAWRLACAKEHIDPSAPGKLPLIFAIDSMLEIADGFKYTLDCRDKESPTYRDGYCASHIGCSSGCTGDSGMSDSPGSGGFLDGFFRLFRWIRRWRLRRRLRWWLWW